MTPFWPGGQAIRMSDRTEVPSFFEWRAQVHRIRGISAHWRVHTEWWAATEIRRDYWEVATDTGLLCVLYHDLSGDAWYLERVYE